MTKLHVIHKDGEPYYAPHGKNAYKRERDAKKVLTEIIQNKPTWKDSLKIASYTPENGDNI